MSTLLDYAQANRDKLMDLLPANSAVLVRSGEEQIRNRDVDYPFRVLSDFYYLCAFSEPESVFVLTKKIHQDEVVAEFTLFLRERDPEKEVWNGRRLGTQAACQLGVDQAYPIEMLDEVLPELCLGCQNLFVSFAELDSWMGFIQPVIDAAKAKSRQGVEPVANLKDLDGILHEQRLIKQPIEIEWMRTAAQISVRGHLEAMKAVAPGKSERQLQGALENGFWQQNSPRVAFNSIVAGGENACILHYTENNQMLNAGDLVLVDAGAEFGCYAGDITTTYPINGKFSPEQAALYALVLKAQQAVIDLIRPGIGYDVMHKTTLQVLTQGLMDLGILQGDCLELIETEAYKPFFMHGTGHWLGMDVHDVGAYKQNGEWRGLEPGMVVTVEPGLYMSENIDGLDARWHSIGIRIEDDVLVTQTGCEVLTTGLPRTVEEIESWMLQNNAALKNRRDD